jgi:nitroreductase
MDFRRNTWQLNFYVIDAKEILQYYRELSEEKKIMIEQVKTRRSIRNYSDRPIEDDKIIQLLESARLAPSGDNTQPWHFIIVKSENTRQKLAEVSHHQRWMLSAPVFIVCVADIRFRIKDNVEISLNEASPQEEVKQIIRDTSIAIEHIVLEAENLGLGTCWVAWFTQEEIRPILNIPSDKYVVSILTLGYAKEIPKARPRKELEKIIHREIW